MTAGVSVSESRCRQAVSRLRRDAECLAAVNRDERSGDHRGGIACQEQDRLSDFFRSDHPAESPGERAGSDEGLRGGVEVVEFGDRLVHHACAADRAGADRVEADFVLRVTQAERPGQADDGQFTDLVNRVLSSRQDSGVAGHVDDRAAMTVVGHVSQRVLRAEERRLQIRVEHTVPVLFGNLINLLDHADSGIVDEDVDASVEGRGEVHEFFELRLAPDVALPGFDAELCKKLVVFCERCEIRDDDFCSVFGEKQCSRSPNPAGSAGDDGCFSSEVCHVKFRKGDFISAE